MEQMVLHLMLLQEKLWTGLQVLALEICLYVWLRISILYQTTRKKLGRPKGFTVNIRDIYVSAGAGFVVAITGTVMTMPGLPLHPAAERIDVNDEGKITGLFLKMSLKFLFTIYTSVYSVDWVS